jgi:hypothetical protein
VSEDPIRAEERVVVHTDEGTSISLGGLGVIHKLSGQDTAGSLAIVEHPLQPGTLGAAPHVHLNEDEYSFVLEGEVGGTDRRARVYGYLGKLRLEAPGHTSHLLERGSAARKDRREYFSSRV